MIKIAPTEYQFCISEKLIRSIMMALTRTLREQRNKKNNLNTIIGNCNLISVTAQSLATNHKKVEYLSKTLRCERYNGNLLSHAGMLFIQLT